MRISDWSSYVCSSDLPVHGVHLSFCRAEDGNPPPALLALGNQLLDRFDDIADGRELGCRIVGVVRNVDVELFLDGEDDLHSVERLDLQVGHFRVAMQDRKSTSMNSRK